MLLIVICINAIGYSIYSGAIEFHISFSMQVHCNLKLPYPQSLFCILCIFASSLGFSLGYIPSIMAHASWGMTFTLLYAFNCRVKYMYMCSKPTRVSIESIVFDMIPPPFTVFRVMIDA
jgi:hypothetical protein